MTRERLQHLINDLSDNSPLNYVGAEDVGTLEDHNYAKNNIYIRGATPEMFDGGEAEGITGMRFFQRPVFSIVRADHPGFAEIKRPELVGEHHLMPEDWLQDAKSVVSIFLPIERSTVESNKPDPIEPSVEWLYTRVDGQRFLLALGAAIRDALIADGYKAVTPYTEARYVMRTAKDAPAPGAEHIPPFSTNWSERHVGVVSGLGTFGLSTNFISRVGCAGRIISLVTDWEPEYDVPDYDDWLGYCNRCGACIRRCPAKAHYADRPGKDTAKCGAFIRETCAKYTPRYGCGKCQTAIPCEYRPMRPVKRSEQGESGAI